MFGGTLVGGYRGGDHGDGFGGGGGGAGVVAEEHGEALGAELLAGRVDCVYDAVREEEDGVAGLELDGQLFVGRVGKEAEGEAFYQDWLGRGGVSLPPRMRMGCTDPALATCRVRVASSQRAMSMVTYWESSLRSWSWSLRAASRRPGGRRRGASERRMPEVSAA